MYFDNRWVPITGQYLDQFLQRINPVGGRYKVIADTTLAQRRLLSFYDEVEMIRIKDPAWTPANLFIYYLRDGDNLYWLNGTSPPLHEVNAKAPIRLTEHNVIDYLAFFSFFVRGADGPFFLAQSFEDAYVPKNISAQVRKVIEGTLAPATFDGVDARGNFLCAGTIYYSNAIFAANFRIEPTGMVHMVDDEPIAADLPVKIDAPVS